MPKQPKMTMDKNTKHQKKQSFKTGPEAEASLEEWQNWANQLQEKIQKLETEERKRIGQLRILRKDIRRKDKALGHYKHINRELEKKIEDYESGFILKWHKRMRRYFRVRD